MENFLSTNKETIRSILQEDLRKTKVRAKFVLHILTPEQNAISAHCRDIVSAAKNDSNFLKSIVTSDVCESWCFQYDLETNLQSAKWKSQNSPQANKSQGKFHSKSKQCSLHYSIVKVLSTKNLFQLDKQLQVSTTYQFTCA
ncbi:FLJ37770-like protein [Trichonephila clavipes]|nr:FLJ37770-like protein [Trichonephila clavipes]